MTNEQLDALEALGDASMNGQRSSLLEFTDALLDAALELIAAARENQRLRDLVRYQRGELHEAGLIDDEEYAVIASDHAAVKRLETYDELKAAARELIEVRAGLALLRAAVREHRDQKGMDRCWIDDCDLYKALGEPFDKERFYPPKEVWMENCEKFFNARVSNKDYDSIWPELESLREDARTLEKLRAMLLGVCSVAEIRKLLEAKL